MKRSPHNRETSSFSTARWATYLAAAGATALASSPAAGDTHYSGLINYKFHQRSPGVEKHSFALTNGIALLGVRYVRGAVDNSATFFMKGPAVSSAFRDFRHYSAAAVALPRGAIISDGYFGPFGRARLQDYACEFPDWQEPGTYFAGFRFDSCAGMQYGWVRIKWAVAPGMHLSSRITPGAIPATTLERDKRR